MPAKSPPLSADRKYHSKMLELFPFDVPVLRIETDTRRTTEDLRQHHALIHPRNSVSTRTDTRTDSIERSSVTTFR